MNGFGLLWLLVGLPVAGFAKDPVHLSRAAPVAGQVVQATGQLTMRLNLDLVSDGQLSVTQKMAFYNHQSKQIRVDRVDPGGQITQATVSYRRHETSEGESDVAKVTFGPVVGHTYTLTHPDLQVSRSDGVAVTPTEAAIVQTEIAGLVAALSLTESLPPTLVVGESTPLKPGPGLSLFSAGPSSLTSGSATLKHLEPGPQESLAHVVVALALQTQPVPKTKGLLALGGELVLGVSTGRLYRATLGGEIKLSGSAADDSHTIQLRGQGPVSVQRTYTFTGS